MPAPSEAPVGRLALLIATSQYRDPALAQLRSPGRDARDLAGVLGDPQIGCFGVQTLVDASSGDVQMGIEDFCADRNPGDQLLIYLSCHGVLDDHGRLYYATANTRRLRLAATAIPAAWLNERLEDCRARRQIVVLDCCHSGAFARGSKGDPALALQHRFESHGRGRVVLTASRGTEYSFEGGQPSGDGVPSVFTRAIIDGLTTGDADRDRDGQITVTDLYQYVYENVRAAEPRQTPELWTYGAEGNLMIARSVRGAVIEPASLPEDLRMTLESPRSRVREMGVAELAGLLDTGPPGLVLAARQALRQIADEDIPRLAVVARLALGATAGTAADLVCRELAGLARPGEQPRTAGGATTPPADISSIGMGGAVRVTWNQRLIRYRRFWLGLLIILAGWIPLLANVPHQIGYSARYIHGYPLLTHHISDGLLIPIVLGVLLSGSAVISACRSPAASDAAGSGTDRRTAQRAGV